MPRFWVISPFNAKYPKDWERVWSYDLKHGIISIGWRELGDVSSLSEEQISKVILHKYSGETLLSSKTSARMLFNFYHGVKPGDIVIARRGVKKIAAIGTVKRTAYYDPEKNLEAFSPEDVDIAYPNHLDVKWKGSPQNIQFDIIKFGQNTIYEITEEEYRDLINNPSTLNKSVKNSLETILAKRQGFQLDSKLRKALEDYAMNKAKQYFKAKGYQWEDLSKYQSFDLKCSKGKEVLYVEVKGTQTDGSEIILTPNEVEFAKEHQKQMALFVLHSIQVSDGLNLSGGKRHLCLPWKVKEDKLKAMAYKYEVPNHP